MTPTNSEYRPVFPEFSAVNDTRLTYFMDQAKRQVSSTAFGESYAHAVYLVTAHLLTVSDPAKAGQAEIASEKAGDLAVSYDNQKMKDGFDEYRQTQYGQQFINLAKSCILTMNVV